MKQRPDTFTQYRYLRYPWNKKLRQLGFKIKITHSDDLLKYSFAVCRADENFNRATVHELLDKRFKSKIWSRECFYDTTLTLAQNVLEDMTFILGEETVSTKKTEQKVNKARKLAVLEARRISQQWKIKVLSQYQNGFLGYFIGDLWFNAKYRLFKCRLPYQI